MFEIFLFILAGVWILAASIEDLRKREVANWLNFSLVAFALGYRAIYAVLQNDSRYFTFGLAGWIVFILLGYGFYYSRIFAGGDAKLMMALGAILPLSLNVNENILFGLGFIFLLMISGSFYGLVYSAFIGLSYFRKFLVNFKKEFRNHKFLTYICLSLAFLILIYVLISKEIFIIPLIILAVFVPFLFFYAKAVESLMIVKIPANKATLGDWLARKFKFRKIEISPHWEGLNDEQLSLIRKSGKEIYVKQGIPFVPAFLIAFILFILLFGKFGEISAIFLRVFGF